MTRSALLTSSLADRLRALSPAATLERGYAVTRLPDGTIVRTLSDAPVGAAVEVVLARGALDARVERTREGDGAELLR